MTTSPASKIFRNEFTIAEEMPIQKVVEDYRQLVLFVCFVGVTHAVVTGGLFLVILGDYLHFEYPKIAL